MSALEPTPTIVAASLWFYVDRSSHLWGPFTIADRDDLDARLPRDATHEWLASGGSVAG